MKGGRWRIEGVAHAERAFSGQKGRMADCSDGSSAEEAGVLKPGAVRLLRNIHLKMVLSHRSPQVVNAK